MNISCHVPMCFEFSLSLLTRLITATFIVSALGCAQSLSAAAPAASNPDVPSRVTTLVAKSKRDMVFVQGGVFQMGDFGRVHSQDQLPYTGQREAQPLHEVELDSFSMGKFKVTYEDFDVYTNATGKPRIAQAKFDAKYRQVPNVPAGVNWQEAKDYCLWLGKVSGLPFDLPTEAQWEYAARNRGQFVIWPTNTGVYEEGKNVASYDQILQMMPQTNDGGGTYPVGKYPPSPLGFYDMASNGWDWMKDWFSVDYYEYSPRKNPQGPETGTEKVQRGVDGGASYTTMTMYRQKAKPLTEPLRTEDGTAIFSTLNHRNGFRCAVNQLKPARP